VSETQCHGGDLIIRIRDLHGRHIKVDDCGSSNIYDSPDEV